MLVLVLVLVLVLCQGGRGGAELCVCNSGDELLDMPAIRAVSENTAVVQLLARLFPEQEASHLARGGLGP